MISRRPRLSSSVFGSVSTQSAMPLGHRDAEYAYERLFCNEVSLYGVSTKTRNVKGMPQIVVISTLFIYHLRKLYDSYQNILYRPSTILGFDLPTRQRSVCVQASGDKIRLYPGEGLSHCHQANPSEWQRLQPVAQKWWWCLLIWQRCSSYDSV